MSTLVTLTYDATENVVFISFPEPTTLRTNEEIAGYFAQVVSFWRKRCLGKKAYFVVDFDNIVIDMTCMDFYAKQSKAAHEECAIASVRYGGDPLQRTAARLAGMKMHRASNICESRAEALAMVRAMKEAAQNE